MQQEPYGEVFLLDKPLQWTSFDVVKKLRNTLKIKKVGHAGTLDPLATGLLIVCAGKMTKQIESFMGQEKEYVGTFVLGCTTESFDLEKPVYPVADPSHLKLHHIQVLQFPFLFSQKLYNQHPMYLLTQLQIWSSL